MDFAEKFERIFKTLLPTPFTIAIGLTVITFFSAYIFNHNEHLTFFDLTDFWKAGLWNNALLVFAFQMMFMLVLGHVLALSSPVDKAISKILVFCKDTATAAALVTFFTVLVSLFNWGLGLIFGAVFARKVADYSLAKGIKINYPLIGAAGYSGLMVWHGGISGSSLIKVSEKGHLKAMMQSILPPEKLDLLPDQLLFDQTVFSTLNIIVSFLLIIILPSVMYLVGKKVKPTQLILPEHIELDALSEFHPAGAERIDYSSWFIKIIGVFFLFLGLRNFALSENWLREINPNNINFLLFGLALFFHKNIMQFLKAVDNAIGGASGILIQFPLYFGIMGVMKESGLVQQLAEFFSSVSNETTFPLFTFISAAIVNIFVPSGGGQWAVQGPVIIQSVLDLKISLSKSIMALAYGDQLTNMLQPFWALPLLGITGLKAKQILPFTFILFITGLVIFSVCLLVF
ncbi:MAG TPA: short-chain fatty acid transporter [Flavobacteriales bacterium]|nr:short-chain fatty acid transporter [Flavobacteriales bacterium]|tara:strand:+ start:1646 stop:3022 length:1377 start_codon:yes stop_codon:yes gene_type:complete